MRRNQVFIGRHPWSPVDTLDHRCFSSWSLFLQDQTPSFLGSKSLRVSTYLVNSSKHHSSKAKQQRQQRCLHTAVIFHFSVLEDILKIIFTFSAQAGSTPLKLWLHEDTGNHVICILESKSAAFPQIIILLGCLSKFVKREHTAVMDRKALADPRTWGCTWCHKSICMTSELRKADDLQMPELRHTDIRHQAGFVPLVWLFLGVPTK